MNKFGMTVSPRGYLTGTELALPMLNWHANLLSGDGDRVGRQLYSGHDSPCSALIGLVVPGIRITTVRPAFGTSRVA